MALKLCTHSIDAYLLHTKEQVAYFSSLVELYKSRSEALAKENAALKERLADYGEYL